MLALEKIRNERKLLLKTKACERRGKNKLVSEYEKANATSYDGRKTSPPEMFHSSEHERQTRALRARREREQQSSLVSGL